MSNLRDYDVSLAAVVGGVQILSGFGFVDVADLFPFPDSRSLEDELFTEQRKNRRQWLLDNGAKFYAIVTLSYFGRSYQQLQKVNFEITEENLIMFSKILGIPYLERYDGNWVGKELLFLRGYDEDGRFTDFLGSKRAIDKFDYYHFSWESKPISWGYYWDNRKSPIL